MPLAEQGQRPARERKTRKSFHPPLTLSATKAISRSTTPAQVAELVDAHGSGPCAARRGGSSPLLGTKTSVLSERNPSIAWVFSCPGTSFWTTSGTTSSGLGCETSGSDGRFCLPAVMLGGMVSPWMIRCPNSPAMSFAVPTDRIAISAISRKRYERCLAKDRPYRQLGKSYDEAMEPRRLIICRRNMP